MPHQGRLYTKMQSGIALADSVLRTLVYGHDHSDLDIASSHFSIAVTLAPEILRDLGASSVQNLLVMLADSYSPSFALASLAPKTILSMSLNAGRNLVSVVRNHDPIHTLFLPQLVHTLSTVIQRYSALVVDRAISLGYRRLDGHTEKNVVYFALESLENRLIVEFIRNLHVLDPKIESFVYIHDGIMVAPPPCDETVSRAFLASKRSVFGSDAPYIKICCTPPSALPNASKVAPALVLAGHKRLASHVPLSTAPAPMSRQNDRQRQDRAAHEAYKRRKCQ